MRQQHQQELGQLKQQFGGFANQMQQQNARLQAQVEMLLNGHGRNAEPEDDVTRARRALMSEAEKSVYDKYVQPMARKLQAIEQAGQRQQAEARTAQKAQQYQAQAREAAVQVGMKGLPEEVAKELLPDFEEEVLSVAWGKRTDMANAAKIVRNRHLKFGLAFVKAQAKLNKQQMDQVKTDIPQPTPGSRAPSARGGDGLPPWNVLTANGYKSYTDWQFDGSPALQWPGK
jgi:hypothetical protein